MHLLRVPFLAAAMALLIPAPGGAATVPTVTVDPGYGPPLTIVKVTGYAFCTTCGPVTISVSSLDVDRATVQPGGTFTKLIRIPGSARPGPALVGAAQNGDRPALTTFTVTTRQPAPKTYPAPASIPAPGNLPPPRQSTSRTPAPAPTSTHATRHSTAAATSTPPPPTGPSTVATPTGQPSGSASPAAAVRGTSGGVNWPAVLAGLATLLVAAAGATYVLIRRRRAGPASG